MITNIIELLHTTAAYQAAALQLMVGEANFAAERLDIKERVSIATLAKTNDDWGVEPPPMGLGGTVNSSNYSFWFTEGKLRSVNKYGWFQKISPPIKDLLELAERPSLLDTNSAYQLATQWLAKLSVDVAELERKFPVQIFQVPARRKDQKGDNLRGSSNNISVPLFLIGWGDDRLDRLPSGRLSKPRPPSSSSAVFIEILGTTKELIEFSIRDPSLLKRPPLQITNASELLGPLPPPRHFVEEFVGGKEAYETVAVPDKVEVWLLTSSFADEAFQEKKDRTGAVKLEKQTAKVFSDVLTNFDSYLWGISKSCIADYGARLRFTRGKDSVDFRLCYECDMLEVTHNGKKQDGDFDPAHNKLVKVIQAIFPNDQIVKSLKIEPEPNR